MKPDSSAQASSSTLRMATMWRCGVRPARPCASPPHALGPRRSFADPKPYTAQLPPSFPLTIVQLSAHSSVMPQQTLAPVVAVLNMKGGVGKTTISAHVMRVLYHHHRIKTLLVDLDPQFNLSQALVSRAAYDKRKDANSTIFSVMEPPQSMGLHDTRASDSPPPRAEHIIWRLRYFAKPSTVSLDLLPGDFRLVKYTMIDNRLKLDSVQRRFLRFIGESRKDYSLICVDCNPSSSFITSCALHACTHILVPIRPDRYSVLGLEILCDFISGIPTIFPQPEILLLLNGIPRRNYYSAIEDELRAHTTFGPKVLTNPLYQSGLLESRAGYTGFATDRPAPWRHLLKEEISAVVDELTSRLGLT